MKKLTVFPILIVFLILLINLISTKTNQNVIDNVNDIKELKKLFRTKTNLLILFVSNLKEAQSTLKVFRETANIIKGVGTLVLLDCTNLEKKKICKKLKVQPKPFIIKHYKDGTFNKDYDRQLSVSSMVNFLRDPTGDLPWEEDSKGLDVVHLSDANELTKLLKKDAKPIMVMFYAPWCGYCKQLKPEYSAAATSLKSKYLLAAIDVDRPESSSARRLYNITGFPTMLYFENGKMKYIYEGENKKDAIVSFMENPTSPVVTKSKEADWSSDTSSEIVHLTTVGFEPVIKEEKSVLIMFYAPWCGHCKRMKPEYEKAALEMKIQNIPGMLAALDATKEASVAKKFGVKGYPTIKYFADGKFKFDVNLRDSEKIIEFMKNPVEPLPPPPPEKSWEEEDSEVEHLGEENFKTFLKKKKQALVMFYAPWCGHCKKTKPEFSAAAESFKDDPRVALAAVDCTRHTAVCSAYEVRGYPTIKYFNYLKTVSEYTGGRTEKDFVHFLKNPSDVNTPEPIGSIEGSDNLLILNDSNFQKEANKLKRLLVLFHTSWCGHCKAMKPDFANAASNIVGDIRLGAVDCDNNPKVVDKFKIKGYPTILLFEHGVYMETYNGPRKTADILKYIKGETYKEEL